MPNVFSAPTFGSTCIGNVLSSPSSTVWAESLCEPVRADHVRAAGNAGEDALLLGQSQRHRERFVVLDRLDVVDTLGIPVRHHEPGPPLDGEGACAAARDRGGARGLVRLDEDPARLQRLRHAHQRAAGAETVAERGHPPVRLLPDLAREVVAMMRDRMRIFELIGGVVTGPRGQLSCALDHVANVLRCDPRPAFDRLHDVELGPERTHQLETLLGEAVGDHDQSAIALCAADERKRGSRAPARVLDDRVAGSDRAFVLGAFDHRERHPVLHRARGIPVLELQP